MTALPREFTVTMNTAAVYSTRNVDMARSLSADHIIDYTQEDFTQNRQHYDLIFVANGSRPISDYQHALSSNGIYVCREVLCLKSSIHASGSITVNGREQEDGQRVSNARPNGFDFCKRTSQSGKVKPVIDRCYLLDVQSQSEMGRIG